MLLDTEIGRVEVVDGRVEREERKREGMGEGGWGSSGGRPGACTGKVGGVGVTW